MIIVYCHCGDEMDRALYIPMDKVTEIHTNADGSDWFRANGEIYYPRVNDCFFSSLYEVTEAGLSRIVRY